MRERGHRRIVPLSRHPRARPHSEPNRTRKLVPDTRSGCTVGRMSAVPPFSDCRAAACGGKTPRMSTSEPSAIQEVGQRLRQFLRLRSGEIGALLKQTVNAWIDDNAPRLGASLAFYTLLSLAPLLIVVVAVAALAFGQKAAQGQLIWEIQDLVGTEGALAIQSLIQSAYKPAAG